MKRRRYIKPSPHNYQSAAIYVAGIIRHAIGRRRIRLAGYDAAELLGVADILTAQHDEIFRLNEIIARMKGIDV